MNGTAALLDPPAPGPPGLRVAWPAARAAYRLRGLGDLRDRPVVLVYQMAKVGSTTVVRSVRASAPGRPVFHCHALTADGIETLERFYRLCRVPSLPWAWHLLASRHLDAQLRRGLTPGRWKVVTLLRDPVARNLSLLFQVGGRLVPGFRQLGETDDLDPLALFYRFEREFPRQLAGLGWFDDELKRVFDVDVFAVPFDRKAGWQVYPGPVADVLLLRTDRLSEIGERALGSFLGLETVRWRQANVGAWKARGGGYLRLLDRIVLPGAYVDRFYEAPEVRHFFSADELAQMRARWCGRRETSA